MLDVLLPKKSEAMKAGEIWRFLRLTLSCLAPFFPLGLRLPELWSSLVRQTGHAVSESFISPVIALAGSTSAQWWIKLFTGTRHCCKLLSYLITQNNFSDSIAQLLDSVPYLHCHGIRCLVMIRKAYL